MKLSLEYLKRCSAETGHQVAALEKVVQLGELAGDIARHPLLGNALALKGGTALNLCFGPPGRLSVDLDYNYIAHVEREKMLAARPTMENAVTELAERHGYRFQRSRTVKKGRRPPTALHLIGWNQKETAVSDDMGVEETGEDAATGRVARGLDCRHEHGPTLGLFCLQSAAQDTNQVRLLFDSSIEAYHPIVPCIQFLPPSAPLPPPA